MATYQKLYISTSTSTYDYSNSNITIDEAYGMPTPSKPVPKDKEVNKTMKDIGIIIDKFNSDRTAVLCARDLAYRCSGNFMSRSHIYNPLKHDEEMAVPNAYLLAVIIHLLDSIKDFKIRANIVREAITALIRLKSDVPSKAHAKGLPRLLIFSMKLSVKDITDVMNYADIRYIEPVDTESSEFVCVTGSMLSKLNN